MDLTTAIGKEVYKATSKSRMPLFGLSREGGLTQAKPVLQLNSFPVTLNPSDYSNPQSNTNPNGSYLTLHAFHQLVNPIPQFSKYYSPSGSRIEEVYDNIINGASVRADSEYAGSVMNSAQKRFSEYKLQSLSGIPGTWHPDYAIPEDWYDITQRNRFRSLDINLADLGSGDGPYTVLSGEPDSKIMRWRVGDVKNPNSSKEIDPDTQLQSLKFKYLEVSIARPWLKFEFFKLRGWYLQGQEKGYCSTGKTSDNMGVFPLLPTSFIVGIDVEVTADWGKLDREIIKGVATGNEQISFGPVLFNSGTPEPHVIKNFKATVNNDTILSPALHVIGWISSLVPFSPHSDGF